MIKRRRLKINTDDVIKCPVSCHCSALERKILPASWLRLLCKTWINAFTFHLHTFSFSSEAHSYFHFTSAHFLFLVWGTLSLHFFSVHFLFLNWCTLSLSLFIWTLSLSHLGHSLTFPCDLQPPFPFPCTLSLSHPRRFKGRACKCRQVCMNKALP